jgi:hypothetical protein
MRVDTMLTLYGSRLRLWAAMKGDVDAVVVSCKSKKKKEESIKEG